MITVILAGGKGTRLADETQGLVPKPMVNIGDMPVFYRIMQIYSKQGYRDFIIAAGHLGHIIERWVEANWDFLVGKDRVADDIQVVNTGEDTQTGGRLLALKDYLPERFFWTYGDGLGNVDLHSLITMHNLLVYAQPDTKMTLTAVNPPPRFGTMEIKDGFVVEFGEKRAMKNAYINGGFYIAERELLDIIPDKNCFMEFDLMPLMARQHILGAFHHNGYWQMMDTPRDLVKLQNDFEDGQPWLEGLRR